MTLLFISLLAGMLTVLAPCVLPLLPVIVGGNAARRSDSRQFLFKRALVITLSLAISVILFSLLLKATTALLGVPQEVWQIISGVIVLLLGVNFLFPELWPHLLIAARISTGGNKSLSRATAQPGLRGAIITGAALGPVFTSCSPTYALILAAVLPASFGVGLLYLSAYAVGMSVVLLLVSYYGARLTKHLGWTLDESGIFRKTLGALFVTVGIAVIFGLDKDLQAFLLELGVYDGTSGLEELFSN